MCPDCSPPSDRSRLSISSITYLSPTGQRTRSMPRSRERDLEADVAHHGRDDRVALQPSFAPAAAARTSACTASPSTMRPRSSTKIARSPSPSNATPSRQPAARRPCARAARDASSRSRRLMLRPSGASPMTVTSKPELAEEPRRHGRRRAVGAVDRERDAGRARPASGSDGAQRVRGSASSSRVARHRRRPRPPAPPTTGRRRSPRPARSSASVNFSPRAGEHLDAVVLERIVRRRDHDARRRSRSTRVR